MASNILTSLKIKKLGVRLLLSIFMNKISFVPPMFTILLLTGRATDLDKELHINRIKYYFVKKDK
jgi:hypothetical protein